MVTGGWVLLQFWDIGLTVKLINCNSNGGIAVPNSVNLTGHRTKAMYALTFVLTFFFDSSQNIFLRLEL